MLHGLAAAALEVVTRRVGLMKGRLPEATWNSRDPWTWRQCMTSALNARAWPGHGSMVPEVWHGLTTPAAGPLRRRPYRDAKTVQRGNIWIVNRFSGLHEGTGAQRVRAGRGRTEAGVAELYEEAACEMADI